MDIQPLMDEAHRLHLDLSIYVPKRGRGRCSVTASDSRPGLTWKAYQQGRTLDEAIAKMLALLVHRKPIVDNYELQVRKAKRMAREAWKRQSLKRGDIDKQPT